MESLMKEKLITASVVGIRWERIHMFLDVKVNFSEHADRKTPLEFYAVNKLSAAKAVFKIISIDDDIYHLTVNITNNGEKRCIPVGTYSLFVCQGDYKMADCEADTEVVAQMENLSRSFLYGGRGKAYVVTFFVEEGGDTLPFRFHTLSAARTGMNFPSNSKLRNQIHPIQNVKKTWGSKRNFLRSLYAFYAKHYEKKRANTILFMSEQNEVIASNLKAVSERMVARGMDSDYRLLFSARAAAAKSQPVKSWIALVKMMAQSGIIFIDDHAPVLDWLPLTQDTKLIQLWHAGAGFKSSGYSRWGHLGCPSPQSCHRQYTYGIAGSKSIAPFFSEVWGINDECVLPTGMPRMDEFLDEDYRKEKTAELYKEYPMAQGKKVILFAPTYRGKNKAEAFYPYDLIDFEGLYEQCGDEYVVFFKMHPWVSAEVPIEDKYKDRFIDVGRYPNINDLFYVTELLITDYSSNIFEYSLMRKPMLFFAFDKIQYSFSRGFHRAYEESAPGKVVYTFDELLGAIAAKDFEYQKVEEYVEHHFDYIDSNASDRVIDWIVLDKMPENIREEIAAVTHKMEQMNKLDFTPELIGEVSEEPDDEKENEEE